jgi:hypothetical protein
MSYCLFLLFMRRARRLQSLERQILIRASSTRSAQWISCLVPLVRRVAVDSHGGNCFANMGVENANQHCSLVRNRQIHLRTLKTTIQSTSSTRTFLG